MTAKESNSVQLERQEHRAVLTIKRGPLNVLDIVTIREMNEVIDSLNRTKGLRVIVITSEGEKAFSAGVDVRDHTKDMVEEMIQVFNRLFYLLDEASAVTIAGVKGAALGGGCELAMACDLVFAADNLKIGQPEVKLAVIAPAACAYLPRLVGLSRAKEILLSGDALGPDEALRIGLVNKVVPLDRFDAELEAFVDRFTANSSIGLTYTKRALKMGLTQGYPGSLEDIGNMYIKELMKTQDANEGLNSFLEKRKPTYKDS